MSRFEYHRAHSFAEAARLVATPETLPLGGGTDLLVAIDEGITVASGVVDLRTIPDSDRIDILPDGGVRLGAAARIVDIAHNAAIRQKFPALASACEAVASPALRNMGTIGGNLCQRPRCWYFRRGISCHKNGGATCPALDGENQYLAILEGGPCYIVHPSDPAVALTVLDATIEVTSAADTRRVPVAEFFVLPRDRMDRETSLRDDEIVRAISIPASAAGGAQMYKKLMQRGAWDFALVSIAAARRVDGSVRIALGGVAPRPWRAPESVEEDVASGGLDDDSIAALADRALYDVSPLSKNGYKVDMAASLLREAMREMSR